MDGFCDEAPFVIYFNKVDKIRGRGGGMKSAVATSKSEERAVYVARMGAMIIHINLFSKNLKGNYYLWT
jgi:hypothetical protein